MARILFHADPHGNFAPLRETIERNRPDAVILLGDQALIRPLEEELSGVDVPVKWIHGNHDMDSESMYDFLFDSPYGCLHGRVDDVAGLRIAGLGGVFQSKIWLPDDSPRFHTEPERLQTLGKGNLWRGGLPRKMRYAIFPADYERLALQRADVLVTHEAPETHLHGFRVLGDLARQMRVRIMLHGHHHHAYESRLLGGITVHGLGLAGSRLVEFDPS